ncbi:MAG: membrane protein insertase YidC [Chloroflexi bacterium]|nr:membrane protein insertase YidC [Chloroflexota bacterium]
MELIGLLWNEIIIRPMINSLLLLYVLLFSNFGLAIIAFTLVVRVVTLPLSLRQAHQMKAMSGLQPKLKDIQERYRNDRAKVSQETMRLYRQAGVSPLGCLGPMVIQFPVWIGLFYAIVQTLPTTPENLAGLSQKLYSWLPLVHTLPPVNGRFLWLDLALPDPTPLVLPILSGASMWVQQKMSTMPSVDPRQRAQNTMMLWMMPIFFVILSLQFPSGLVLYWVVSNVIGIVIQYFVTGWGSLFGAAAPVTVPATPQPAKETAGDGEQKPGGDSQDGGGGRRARAKAARRKSRGGRGRGR